METIREQIAMGRHCVHGTAVGTPGGADIMCGRCEDGATRWVPTPLYAASVTVTLAGHDKSRTIDFRWATAPLVGPVSRWLRTDDPDKLQKWTDAIASEVRGWSIEWIEYTDVVVTTEVQETGYWDVP